MRNNILFKETGKNQYYVCGLIGNIFKIMWLPICFMLIDFKHMKVFFFSIIPKMQDLHPQNPKNT